MKKLSLFGTLLILLIFLVIPSYIGYGEQEVIEEWVATNSTPSSDKINCIATDAAGNVYVAGSSYSEETLYDFITIKYETDGDQAWIRKYNGPLNMHETIVDMAVDSTGNVHVTGGCRTATSYIDYLTIKYDTDGNTLWEAWYDAGRDDHSRAIAIDNEGNVYVTGRAVGYETQTIDTVKYDSGGNVLWCAIYHETGAHGTWPNPSDIAVDPAGNVYVTGICTRSSDNYQNYLTIKYDSSGTEIWAVHYERPYTGSTSYPSLVVDSDGNIYIAGDVYIDETCWGSLTIKYNTDGQMIWDAIYNGSSAKAIAVSPAGNVYVTGIIPNDCFTIKYDSLGNEEWVAIYSGTGFPSFDNATGIVLDSSENVYISGDTFISWSPMRWWDYLAVKYDSEGNEIWAVTYDGPEVESNDRTVGIALDLSKNVFLTGNSGTVNVISDATTVKYSQKLPPEEQIQNLIDDVDNLLNEGKISDGKARGMIRKLNEALDALERGNETAACRKLHDFIDQVNAAILSDPLTPEEGQALIDAANEIINELCGSLHS
jgi:hypothetical protein